MAKQTVFVTGQGVAGDMNPIGGPYIPLPTPLERADSICQREAERAGLPGWFLFKAWLSTSTQDAKDRIPQGPGPYVLPDGTIVAATTDALLDAQSTNLSHWIGQSASGTPVNALVWTGTYATGDRVVGRTCTDWSTDAGFGWVGSSFEQTLMWTSLFAYECYKDARLYCFGPPLPPVPATTPWGVAALVLALGAAMAMLLARRRA